MKIAVVLLFAALGAVGTVHAQPTVPEGASLDRGIAEYREGDLANAVLTLESAIRGMADDPLPNARELTQCYLYRGAAFVGLGRERQAKGSFAAALKYDPALRISADDFPPRVVRVFEAARTGRTESVLLPPASAAKQAGISGIAIAAVGAGVAAVGGFAATRSSSAGSTTPPPTYATPSLNFISSNPAPGSTLIVTPGQRLPLTMEIVIVSNTATSNGALRVSLMNAAGESCAGGTEILSEAAAPGLPVREQVVQIRWHACPLPQTTVAVLADFLPYGPAGPGTPFFSQSLPISYRFVSE